MSTILKNTDLPPSQIVPRLADLGVYLASESSFYRILKAADQLHHRGRAKAKPKSRPPTTHRAAAANEVWTWDISYLPSGVRGPFFYLYLIVDIFSRKIVGSEIHERELAKRQPLWYSARYWPSIACANPWCCMRIMVAR